MQVIVDITSTQDQLADRGIGKYTKQVVSRMISYSQENKKGDIFHLLTFNSPTTLSDTIKQYPEIVRTVNIGKLRVSGKFNTLWLHTQFIPAVRGLIKKEKPDLYFCPYFWRGAPYNLLPTVVTIHDFALPKIKRYSSAPKYVDWLRGIQYHWYLRKIKKASLIITDSENTQNDVPNYVKVPSEKIQTVHLGVGEHVKPVEVDKEILAKYLPERVISRGYMLYYGGVELNKNVRSLVLAYDKLRKLLEKKPLPADKKFELPYLVLAGADFTRLDMRNSVLSELKYLIDELGLDDHVYFTGYFDEEDISQLLCGATIFVHLSLYEGFGFAPLEAMKCGIPVVASNRSCYPEILGNGAELVDPEDIEKVSLAIYRILEDKGYASELAQRGEEKANSYTWNKTAQKTYNLLKEVAEKK